MVNCEICGEYIHWLNENSYTDDRGVVHCEGCWEELSKPEEARNRDTQDEKEDNEN